MNSVISVDLSEVITIDTDLSPTAEELLELVNDQPFLIDVSLEHSLPRLRRYAEDNFGCAIELNTLCTIEGHASVEVRLKHFAVKTCYPICANRRWTCFPVKRHHKNISSTVALPLHCL